MLFYFQRILLNYPSRKILINNSRFLVRFNLIENLLNKNQLTTLSHENKSRNFLARIDKRNITVKPTNRAEKMNNKTKEKNDAIDVTNEWTKLSQMTLIQRYKTMIKKYWYVALPVHAITSAIWFGAFYIAAKCGVDAKAMIERLKPYILKIPMPEYVKKLLFESSDSSTHLGYVAIAFVFYKFATPLRYATTVAGTGIAIKHLVKKGLIKPAPSAQQIKQVIRDSNLKQVLDQRLRSRELLRRQMKSAKSKRKY